MPLVPTCSKIAFEYPGKLTYCLISESGKESVIETQFENPLIRPIPHLKTKHSHASQRREAGGDIILTSAGFMDLDPADF